jgi:hypothetical protein
MFIALYRWRIKKGMEQQFINAWSEVTAYFRENCNSLGSRLHRDNEGLFYGYAQWKTSQARDRAFDVLPDLSGRQQMREAIEESLPEIVLETLSDYLILPDSK